jgi:uncharacterized protein (TIGR03067 family)
MKALEGTWLVVGSEMDGKNQLSRDEREWWEFKGNRFISRVCPGGHSCRGTFTLDPCKVPKEIDMFIEEYNENFKFVGIYRLEGDRLTIRFHSAKDPRPKTFTTKPGTNGHYLIVLKRSTE